MEILKILKAQIDRIIIGLVVVDPKILTGDLLGMRWSPFHLVGIEEAAGDRLSSDSKPSSIRSIVVQRDQLSLRRALHMGIVAYGRRVFKLDYLSVLVGVLVRRWMRLHLLFDELVL